MFSATLFGAQLCHILWFLVIYCFLGVILEKLFRTVLSDYGDRPLNLHGRVCLQYSIHWGLLSVLLLYVIDKWTYRFVESFDRTLGNMLLVIFISLAVACTLLILVALGRLAPERVLINTFPQVSLVLRYEQLTGLERRWVRVPRHLGNPSPFRRELAEFLSDHRENA